MPQPFRRRTPKRRRAGGHRRILFSGRPRHGLLIRRTRLDEPSGPRLRCGESTRASSRSLGRVGPVGEDRLRRPFNLQELVRQAWQQRRCSLGRFNRREYIVMRYRLRGRRVCWMLATTLAAKRHVREADPAGALGDEVTRRFPGSRVRGGHPAPRLDPRGAIMSRQSETDGIHRRIGRLREVREEGWARQDDMEMIEETALRRAEDEMRRGDAADDGRCRTCQRKGQM